MPDPAHAPVPASIVFGPFTLDLAAAQLRCEARVVPLRPKAYDLLCTLARRPGELVTKDELLDAVWGRRFVSEGVIKSAVSELRQALSGEAQACAWIETVPRRGYRFSGALASAGAPAPAARPPPALPLPPERPSDHHPPSGNLAAAQAPLIGREADSPVLAAWLASHLLVTMAGPSGVGKTRMALDWAAQHRLAWPDGVWLVELAHLSAATTDVPALCAALAQTLGLATGAGANPQALARALQPMRLMLVLDNAEHLLEPVSQLLLGLLAHAPGLRVLVTSQEPLHMAEEQVYRLPALAVPDAADGGDLQRLMAGGAAQLFMARAAARLPGFALKPGQHAALASICRALDGLPLALELAAARVPVLGVDGIAELLAAPDGDGSDARLHWLNRGTRGAAARQRSLREALAWSHALLDEPQRRVFRRLGVFSGGFSLAAAQAVCAEPGLDAWAVLEALQALVDKSLVVADASAGRQRQERFLLLESPRSFALECLALANETAPVHRRHALAVADLWARAQAEAFDVPLLQWLAQHTPDTANLRAALQWAHRDADWPEAPDVALALVVHGTSLWHRAGMVVEGRAACERVRAQAGVTSNAALQRGFVWALAALSAYGFAYPPEEVLPAVLALPETFVQLGDPKSAYLALSLIHALRVRIDANADHGDILLRMRAIEQPGWDEFFKRVRRMTQLHLLRHSGPASDFLAACRAELHTLRRLGATADSWSAAQYLMLAESDAGDMAAALAAGQEAITEIRACGRLRQHGHLMAIWTGLLAEHRPPADARQALAELVPILRSMGTLWMAHRPWAWLAAREGRLLAAARLLGWMLSAQGSPGAATPGRTVVRSTQALQAHLSAELGAAALATALREGAALGDDAAAELAMGTSP